MATVGQQINSLKTGEFLSIEKIIPIGSLEARRLASGAVRLYWRFTHGGKTDRQTIGFYDSKEPVKATVPNDKGGFSIEAARRAAESLAGKHELHLDEGGHAALKQAARQAKADAADAAERATKFTLSSLLDDYCDYNDGRGRTDVADARGIIKLHIKEAFPKIAAKPAAQCTQEDFVDMMRRLHHAGKKRTSNKLRSYARAAYEVARSSRTNGAIPERFKLYGVTHNPVSDTSVDPSGNRPDKNPLTLDEMRLYWRLIEHLPDVRGAVLRVHLLSGAQRIAQLVRMTNEEMKEGTLMLWDRKGKPGKGPRPHPIPMPPALAKAVADCKPAGKYILSTDGGETHIANTTLSGWAQQVVGTRITGFAAKRLRSGVETLLARAKIHREERGRIQSHGIGGVQETSYNAYEYMDEKYDALETLHIWLATTPEVKLEKQRLQARRARLARAGLLQ